MKLADKVKHYYECDGFTPLAISKMLNISTTEVRRILSNQTETKKYKSTLERIKTLESRIIGISEMFSQEKDLSKRFVLTELTNDLLFEMHQKTLQYLI